MGIWLHIQAVGTSPRIGGVFCTIQAARSFVSWTASKMCGRRGHMKYTVRYAIDGDRKETCGLSPERAKELCQELAKIGIATTEIFGESPTTIKDAPRATLRQV
jgi:hypothetical protein